MWSILPHDGDVTGNIEERICYEMEYCTLFKPIVRNCVTKNSHMTDFSERAGT